MLRLPPGLLLPEESHTHVNIQSTSSVLPTDNTTLQTHDLCSLSSPEPSSIPLPNQLLTSPQYQCVWNPLYPSDIPRHETWDWHSLNTGYLSYFGCANCINMARSFCSDHYWHSPYYSYDITSQRRAKSPQRRRSVSPKVQSKERSRTKSPPQHLDMTMPPDVLPDKIMLNDTLSQSSNIDKFIETIHDYLLQMSLADTDYSHYVQLIIKKVSNDLLPLILTHFHGQVINMISSKHANFVIACIIENMHTRNKEYLCQFIINELIDSPDTSCKKIGCRIWRNIIMHTPPEMYSTIIDKLIIKDMINREFGRHVIIAIIQHGCEKYKTAVINIIEQHYLDFSRHKYGSYVIEAALSHSPTLVDYITESIDTLNMFATDNISKYILIAFINEKKNIGIKPDKIAIVAKYIQEKCPDVASLKLHKSLFEA